MVVWHLSPLPCWRHKNISTSGSLENNGLKYFWENMYLLFGLFDKQSDKFSNKAWENSASFTKKDKMIMKLHKIKKASVPFGSRNVIPLRYYSLRKILSIHRDYQHLLVPKLEVNSQLHALILPLCMWKNDKMKKNIFKLRRLEGFSLTSKNFVTINWVLLFWY